MNYELEQASNVISLVVTADDRPGRLLLGVRRATVTQTRHPNVLSSPTMKIPAAVMKATLRSVGLQDGIPRLGEIQAIPRSAFPAAIGCPDSLARVEAFLAETLLARKLGLADALVTGRLRGTAEVAVLALDIVFDPADAQPRASGDETLMLSLLVNITAGTDVIPQMTPSYSRIEWVPAREVEEAVSTRDPLRLISDVDINVCLYGLCVRSAAAVAPEVA